jgi:hypothetical protein
MTLSEFKASLKNSHPLAHFPPALTALWRAGKDEWDAAHRIVMDDAGKDCAWVHAYLHRVEGDLDNAHYWYSKARRPVATCPLAEEWDAIAKQLIAAM